MKKNKSRPAVSSHYDATIDISRDQYDKRALTDPNLVYPANYFRLKLLEKSFKKRKIHRVFEVGVGEGTPLIALAKQGFDVQGLDIAPKMVETCRENFTKVGLDPSLVFLADIQDKKTYGKKLKGKKFDGLIAMGVLPHVEDERKVITNMRSLVRPGGSVFIEFRNSLFSLFTQNRHTAEFFLTDLLKDVDPKLKKHVKADLGKRLRMDQPEIRSRVAHSKAPGYDAILSKFHNPFEVKSLFEGRGFKNVDLLWYHYHPAMPYLQKMDPKLFLKEAVRLEGRIADWRAYFLCSAFVVEARV